MILQNKYVERNQEWAEKARELLKIKQMIKEYSEMESLLMDELKKISEFTPSKYGNFVFDYSVRKGNVDYGRIPELKFVDLDKYRKEPIEIWKVSMVVE